MWNMHMKLTRGMATQKQDSMSRKNTPEVSCPPQVKVCSISPSLSFIHVNKGAGKANTDWKKEPQAE